MDPAITSLLTIAGSGIAAYYGAYFKKRGEDKAMQDGFAEVLRQTTETTRATKDIEAKISDEVWDRQKRWELKREVLFAATKNIAALENGLLSVDSVLQVERTGKADDDPGWSEAKYGKLKEWSIASAAFDETRVFVAVVGSEELKKAFDEYGSYMNIVAARISPGKDAAIYEASRKERDSKCAATRLAIRKELGLES